jgi:16S rRNA C1402 N4-methylase RsmH
MVLPDVLDAAHSFVARAVHEGEVGVDATVGNGHDTRFLARQVGPAGRVFGFDIQETALDRTRERLRKTDGAAPVELFHAGHEQMRDRLPEGVCGGVSAVMFNLGYLPGSESACITQPDTTRAALQAAAEVLRPGGVITVVVYTGHAGGEEEAEAVRQWAEAQPQDRLHVLSYAFVNQKNNPPHLLAIEKRRAAG